MKVEMLMPQMGESIAEATVVRWLKAVGDIVEKDEVILEISTDKVDSEIPAPASGKLIEVKVEPGQTVPVRSAIAVIESEEEPKEEAPKPAPTLEPKPGKKEQTISPLARNLAQQKELSTEEVSEISGSGVQGRVTKADVADYIEGKSQKAKTPAVEADTGPIASMPSAGRDFAPDQVRYEPMDNMRRRIAEHMVRSKATSPHVYTVQEADMTNVARWRQRNQAAFQEREGFKLSFTPFFLEATAKALTLFPYVNASLEGENILLRRNVHLGCAVAVGDPEKGNTGLVVPVIRNADQLSFVGLARELNNLAVRARNRRLTADDLIGGTFSVTNPGIFGAVLSYPIINQPQAGILALGVIKKRPMIIHDMIAVREMTYLTLSYDHRIIDGAVAGNFLRSIVNYLENWDMNREV